MNTRTVRKVVTGTTQYDGAGVKLVRVIGHADVKDFDPFLMLDAFDSTHPEDYVKGFPWHPHRGIETVTYLIEGDIEHKDSLGNAGSIRDGSCQWMTAGGGILHQEMPQACGRMLGVQLWLNLPAKAKMTPPKYHDIRTEMVPVVREDGCTVRLISGSYHKKEGAVRGDHVAMHFLDVELDPDVLWKWETNNEENVFVYIILGAGRFAEAGGIPIEHRSAVLFSAGDELAVRAAEHGIRFLVFAGMPLHEPVAWGGPIVMNTREELAQAFRDLEDGTFVK